MKRSLVLAAGLAIAITSLAAPPADTPVGAGWFEATIADNLRRLQRGNATDRARYMACGYVAPALIRANAEAAAQGDDSAFADMLERLRAVLRPAGEGR